MNLYNRNYNVYYTPYNNPYNDPYAWMEPNVTGGYGQSRYAGIGGGWYTPYKRDLGYIQGGNNAWTYNYIGPHYDQYGRIVDDPFNPFDDDYSGGLAWNLKKK